LNQILVNLLSNAIKFTDKGIVSLKILSILDQEEVCRIRFEIKDSGIGISKDKIKTIFQSFTQANADTSRKYGGTGLGLSIVKNLLNLLGSNIEVSSNEMEGSTFSFELNLEKCLNFELNNPQKPVENLNNRLNGVRILLAEDNKVNQLFAHELITDWGASLDIADNGKIALEMLQKFNYDLILMDIQMPEMSGLDATIHIREQMTEPIKSIPIIAMTANAMKGDDEKYLNAGVNDVIFKPFEPYELFSKIEPILKSKKIIIPKSKIKGSGQINAEELTLDLTTLQVVNLSTLKAFSRGKQEFIVKMIGILSEAIPGMINLLERAIQQEDLSMIRHHSHKLIPNMNMLGNIELETNMKWIEDNALEVGMIKEISDCFKRIEPLLKILISEVIMLNEYYQSKKQVTL
jgi:CheY-like chemotaxis protein